MLDDDFINITSIAHVDANGEIRIDQADLHALSDLLEEYERNRGGTTPQDLVLVPDPAPVCDIKNATVTYYLIYWFANYESPHECETDDHLIWIFEN